MGSEPQTLQSGAARELAGAGILVQAASPALLRTLREMPKNGPLGPRTWRNWHRWQTAEPTARPSSEGALYSDAHVTNHLIDGCGPHRFLNGLSFTAASGGPKGVLPAIVVRQWWLLGDDDMVALDKTDYTIYHGASQLEEIAALASCALGMRCRAAGLTRVWWLDPDELGRPVGFDHVVPYLAPRRDHRGSVLPALNGTVDLADLRRFLLAYRDAPADKATEILRAARMYQQAVWVADDDPNLAWLRLVGAAEVAANHWRGEKLTPVDVLKKADPDLAALLESRARSTWQLSPRSWPAASALNSAFSTGYRGSSRPSRPNVPTNGGGWIGTTLRRTCASSTTIGPRLCTPAPRSRLRCVNRRSTRWVGRRWNVPRAEPRESATPHGWRPTPRCCSRTSSTSSVGLSTWWLSTGSSMSA
jgi:hypothetical protein